MKNSKIILINKPSGISSYKEIRKIGSEYNFEKIGHAGTLDPLAQGLMIAMSNKATKLSDLLMKKDKVYFVEMVLGFETDTLDLEGEIIEKASIPKNINIRLIGRILEKFVGEIEQIPPKYSAIKVNGRKLYNLARKNIDVVIPKRNVKIEYIKDIELKDNKISFRTKVSSGTYIRSLVRDIAYKLGTVATMSYLLRESIAQFKNPKNVEIINVEDAIILDKITLNSEEYIKIKNGQTIKINYDGNCDMLHCYSDLQYKGIVDIIHKKNGIINIKRNKFFE
ncbi:tRNA pseudouridine(55) synthase TruB [Oceanivirga salmonicida]|uniref:tRNA pseudouridine(55) synthase TruB n=1 Tax=Oceanivirga salmonicida TaxID=1769291 RepID=UPI00082AB72A|nr:tRNA pseudouridine(55) synthase TruB [Oceanivirga salmonicida]